jgi:hypothetical protein
MFTNTFQLQQGEIQHFFDWNASLNKKNEIWPEKKLNALFGSA